MRNSLIPLTLFLAATIPATLVPAAPPPAPDKLTETEIAPFPKRPLLSLGSPDARHYAVAEETDTKINISYDGKIIANSTSPPKFTFSPDSKRFACTGEGHKVSGAMQQDVYSVIDGREIPNALFVTFSPDSKHVAFRFDGSNGETVVLDGVQSAPYRNIMQVVFSPNSKRLAVVYTKDAKCLFTLDGQAVGPPARLFREPAFSPDSKHVACVADIGKFGADQFCMMRDGVLGTVYDSLSFGPPMFSPDSKHLAYIAVMDKKLLLVVDGKEKILDPRHGTSLPAPNFAFSPDSKSMLYVKDGKTVVETDGVEKPYDAECRECAVFSPDSKRFAYLTRIKTRSAVADSGIPGKEYKAVVPRSIAFSPDSKHLLYAVYDDTGVLVVIDGKESEPVDAILPLAPISAGAACFAFTPNSAAVEYLAVRDKKLYRIHVPLVSQ